MKYILIFLFIVSGKCSAQDGHKNKVVCGFICITTYPPIYDTIWCPKDSLSKYRNVGDTGGGNTYLGNYPLWYGLGNGNTHIGPDTLPVITVDTLWDGWDFTLSDSALLLSNIQFTEYRSGNSDSPFVSMNIDEHSDTTYTVVGDSLTAIKLLFKAWAESFPNYKHQFDSSKFYYKKYIYWQRKMNDELEKINRFQTPNITKALFRYQDSTLKYETLLNKLKKQTK